MPVLDLQLRRMTKEKKAKEAVSSCDFVITYQEFSFAHVLESGLYLVACGIYEVKHASYASRLPCSAKSLVDLRICA